MEALKALKRAFWRSEPTAPSDDCPWCGDLVLERNDRVRMGARVYHQECAVARLDAGELTPDGSHTRPAAG